MRYGEGGRFVMPGYRRSLREHLYDQRVKMSAAISGRWMPSSKEIRMAKLGALKDLEKERLTQPQRPPSRRLQQAGYRVPGTPLGLSEGDAARDNLLDREEKARLLRRKKRETSTPHIEED